MHVVTCRHTLFLLIEYLSKPYSKLEKQNGFRFHKRRCTAIARRKRLLRALSECSYWNPYVTQHTVLSAPIGIHMLLSAMSGCTNWNPYVTQRAVCVLLLEFICCLAHCLECSYWNPYVTQRTVLSAPIGIHMLLSALS